WHTSGPNVDLSSAADIVLNGVHHPWTVTGEAGAFDVQATVTHEAGHALGLDHSPVRGATMYWQLTRVSAGGASGTQGRRLSGDDMAGVRDLYGTGAGTGSLAGTVHSDIGGQGMIVGAVHLVSGDTI